MRSNKLFIAVLLIGIGLFALTACGGAATTVAPAEEEPAEAPAEEPVEAPAEEPAPEPVILEVMIVDYIPDVTDTWLEEEIAPAFEAEHPDIDVQFVYVNWGTLDETIQGYFAAGDGADILNLGSEYIAEYGSRMADLSEYFADWDGLPHFVAGTMDTVTWEGKPRGIPWLTAPRALMCRMDILAEAGFDAMPTTYEEVLAVTAGTTVIEENALVRQGYESNDDVQEYIGLIWALGGSLYKDDGTPNFDSPEARAALEFLYNRYKAIRPNEGITPLPEPTGSRIASGESACLYANLWGAPPTSDAIWEQIQLAPLPIDPAFPNAEPKTLVFNDWLAVPAYSQHVAEAAEFLKFLGSAENLNTYNAGFGSFPPRDDAWFGFVEDPVMQAMGEVMRTSGVGFADVRASAPFREMLRTQIDLYYTDQQDLDTTLANIQDQYTTILEDAGYLP